MKRLFLLAVCGLLLHIAFSQSLKDTLVDMRYYKVLYSQKYENPLRVTFKLYKPTIHASRARMVFKGYKGIVTSKDADYIGNVYDKGHMASAESFADSKDKMESTFNYINSGLQHYELNRGTWKSLEDHERNLAQADTLYVACGALFIGNIQIKLSSGATVPTHFYKILTQKGIKTYYLFPNMPCDKDFKKYEVKDIDWLKF